jgi:hypothetical protein
MRQVLGLVLLCPFVAGCTSHQGHPPVPSPDGTMILHTRIERSRQDPVAYLCVIFEIRDPSGRLLYSENTRASDTMRWNVSWVANDRIRLVSSDIGTYDWQKQPGGGWVREPAKKPTVGGPGS